VSRIFLWRKIIVTDRQTNRKSEGGSTLHKNYQMFLVFYYFLSFKVKFHHICFRNVGWCFDGGPDGEAYLETMYSRGFDETWLICLSA
jgi:hypothetical protein